MAKSRCFTYSFSLLVSIIILTSNVICSQELITKEAYTFYDTSGNIYIQKSQPLYLWLGFTPDSTEYAHLLKSDTSKKYTNPFYLDKEGLNTIRSPWAVDTETNIRIYPLEEIEFEIYADGITPKTSLIYGSAKLQRIGKTNYLSNGKSIKLKSTDATSGIYNTYYSINGADFRIYKEPLDCSNEKEFHGT